MSYFTLKNGEKLYYEDTRRGDQTIITLHGWKSTHMIKDGKNLIELREIMEAGVIQLAMRNAGEDEFKELERKLNLLKAEIALGVDNVENIFEADNAFHTEISSMGHNPLVTKLENVVRLLTHAMRYQTVKHMIENGRGEELYEAHAELTNILKTRKRENLNEAVRKTYFDQVPQA